MVHIRLSRLLGGRRWVVVVLAAVGVAVAATWAAQALLLSRVLAAVVPGRTPGAGTGDLGVVLAALTGVLVARPLLVLVRQLLAQRLMTRTKQDLRGRVTRAFLRRAAAEPGAGRTGRDHAVVVDGIENLDPYLSTYLPQLLVTGVVVTGVGTLMVVIDPVVGLVAVASTLVLPLLPRTWDRVLARRGADHWDAYQNLHAEFVDSMHGMTTLVTFGAQHRREAELVRASGSLLARTLHQLRVSLIESGLNTFALAAVPLAALVAVAGRRETLTALEVFALVLLAVELVRPLRDLASSWHAGYLGTFSGAQVLDVLAADEARAAATPDPAAPADWTAPVVLRGVCARHAGSDRDALRDVDLTLHPGLTAVVGATGSGKSTLAAVLVGLIPVTEGTVELCGAPVGPDELLARVTLVPQDPVLAAGSVADNIALGLPARPSSDARGTVPGTAPDAASDVAAAARTAGIGTEDPTVDLATPVGERGVLISGGQRQRVAVARGLVQGREVLVLDESTSALDGAGEARLVDAVLATDPARPVLAVTHRLDVARTAAWVVVLDDGRVVEQGPPEQLLAAGGAYAALVGAVPVAAR